MKDTIPRIEIDMDKPCNKCGKNGATQGGRCLSCVSDSLLTPADPVATLLERQSGLVSENADVIAQALSESEEGKLTVSISFKLTRVKDRLYCASTLAFSQKFTSESEDSIAVTDPNQPKLI